jgi:DNA-binding winged helix-turn-helix (wHTH) protein
LLKDVELAGSAPSGAGHPTAGYRFHDVVVDTARQVVSIAGQEVTCQPRVFQLLHLLCAAGGAVVARDAILARLWPGQAVVSDESLTQVVHRLRATLGTHGAAVRTVRGAGFRLDAPLHRLDRVESGGEESRGSAGTDDLGAGPQTPAGTAPLPAGGALSGNRASALGASVMATATHAPVHVSEIPPEASGLAMGGRADPSAMPPAGRLASAVAGTASAATRSAALPAGVSPEAPAPAPAGGVPVGPAQGASSTSRRLLPRAWWWGTGAVLLLAAAAAALWLSLAGPWQVLDSGYALRRADLSPARRQTIDLVARALAAERGGDRAQARHLLEIAHATDPSTPVPATFRCLFSFWQVHTGEAEAWAKVAAGRLRPDSSPYLHLLVRYAAATAAGRGADWLAAASALLAIRPSAWYLRLARAHYHLGQREEAAALADLRQIPIPSLNAFSQALVLADRASLGDVAGAEHDLAAGRLQQQEALVWYARGRIARSKRQPRTAVAAFDHERDVAVRRNQPDLVPDARLLGGISACEAGDLAGCASRLDLAAAAAIDQHFPDTAIAALGLGAYLAWLRHDLPGRDRRLAEAASLHADPEPAYRLSLTLLALWTGARPPDDPRALAALLQDVPELTGTRALLQARQSWAAGDPIQARRQLRQARAEGIDKTYFLEEADLLAADLGDPPIPLRHLRVDPPYPNLLRLAAAYELTRRHASAR